MPGPRSHGLPSPIVCAVIVIAMLAMIILPAAITLHTVHVPAPIMPVNQNSTPHGYTFSLLLFLFPSCSSQGGSCPVRDCTSRGALSGGLSPSSSR
jgi:hypothetical protein